jgi:hypothetical protein
MTTEANGSGAALVRPHLVVAVGVFALEFKHCQISGDPRVRPYG